MAIEVMLIGVLFGILLLFIILATLLLKTVTVIYYSMEPTLKHGDRLLAICPWPKKWLRKGQVVIIRSNLIQADALEITYLVKRVIGLPGEKLITKLIDLDETRQVLYKDQYDEKGEHLWHIPDGYFFVLGDNRISRDSRDCGPISLKQLAGIAILKLPGKALIEEPNLSEEGIEEMLIYIKNKNENYK
jgi:signal peptidase I